MNGGTPGRRPTARSCLAVRTHPQFDPAAPAGVLTSARAALTRRVLTRRGTEQRELHQPGAAASVLSRAVGELTVAALAGGLVSLGARAVKAGLHAGAFLLQQAASRG